MQDNYSEDFIKGVSFVADIVWNMRQSYENFVLYGSEESRDFEAGRMRACVDILQELSSGLAPEDKVIKMLERR